MTLAQASEGQTVKVLKMNSKGAIRQRLLDMGIGREAELKIERYAPLQDPIHIIVKGYSLALRVTEGEMIDVEVLSK